MTTGQTKKFFRLVFYTNEQEQQNKITAIIIIFLFERSQSQRYFKEKKVRRIFLGNVQRRKVIIDVVWLCITRWRSSELGDRSKERRSDRCRARSSTKRDRWKLVVRHRSDVLPCRNLTCWWFRLHFDSTALLDRYCYRVNSSRLPIDWSTQLRFRSKTNLDIWANSTRLDRIWEETTWRKSFDRPFVRLTRCSRKIHRRSSAEEEWEFASLVLVQPYRPEPIWPNPGRPMQNSSMWWCQRRWRIASLIRRDSPSSRWSSLELTWWWRTSAPETRKRIDFSSGRRWTIYLSDEFGEIVWSNTIDSIVVVFVEDRIFLRVTLDAFGA